MEKEYQNKNHKDKPKKNYRRLARLCVKKRERIRRSKRHNSFENTAHERAHVDREELLGERFRSLVL